MLCCGVTKEEVAHPCTTVDILLYGGTTDVEGNVYHVKTWRTVESKFPDGFETVFIDGGIHNNFKNLEEKELILNIIHTICKKKVIIYGDHLLRRYNVGEAKTCPDPLARHEDVMFTEIPIQQYTLENMKLAVDRATGGYYEVLRCKMEYHLKF
jgi:hypothetical protein